MNLIVLVIIIIFLILIFPRYRKPIIINNFLSDEECDKIKKMSINKLVDSSVGEKREISKTIRDSKSVFLSKNDPFIHTIYEKVKPLTDRPICNYEDLQVVKYTKGGFYKPHQDTFCDQKNYRMYTLLICLDDRYEGGETVFPKINKTYKLKKGDALLFDTLDSWGNCTDEALHGGNPIKNGEKWICNIWIHKYKNT